MMHSRVQPRFSPPSPSATLHQALSPRARQRSEVSAQISNVLIAELFDDRLHDLIFPGAAAEENQLPLHKGVRLPRRRRDVFGLGYTSLSMTRRAERRFFLDRIISREASYFVLFPAIGRSTAVAAQRQDPLMRRERWRRSRSRKPRS